MVQKPTAWTTCSGLARNDRLEKAIVPELITATIDSIRTGKTARRFKDFRYTTLGSWSRERRVISARRRSRAARPIRASLSPR